MVFGATLLAYWPALRGGLLWDDEAHVTKPALRSLHGLWRIWFEIGASQQYYPILHSAFWVEHRLWGDATLGYHLVNVLLHATSACLFAAILSRLGAGRVGPSRGGELWPWLAALLFALHPICVESVAWISEQKNTLSTVFYLLAVLAYLRFDRDRRPRFYLLGLALFLLALASKSVTSTLPAALLVVLWWRHGALGWRRDVLPLLPWFVVGITGGLVTAWVERQYGGAVGAPYALSLGARCLLAGRILWFYLGKLFWPTNLMFIYPHWRVDPAAAWQYSFLVGAVLLLGGLWWQRRRFPGALAAFLFFAGSLFPALGFFNVYPFIYSYVADHFQYLASLGILAAIAAGWGAACARWPERSAALLGAAAAVVVLCGALSWRQCRMYRDGVTLFEETLRRNPDCWMADNNLGIILYDRGHAAESVAHFLHAERVLPDNALNFYHLGTVFYNLHRYPEAIAQLEETLRINPSGADGHYTLANVLADAGRTDEALAQFQEAIRLKPLQAEYRANYGALLTKLGRLAEALEEFEEAVKLDPKSSPARSNLAIALVRLNRLPEALVQFQEEVRLGPDLAMAHYDYGTALMSTGDGAGALEQFGEALRINPAYTDARINVGVVLTRFGRRPEALAQFAQAVQHDPANPSAHTNYGVGLAGAGRLDEAIAEFRESVRLRPSDPEAHADLARALGQVGRSEEARAELETAQRLSPGR